MRELDYTPAELADRAGVSYLTVKYFGFLLHDQDTLERLSVALDWPPDKLREIWEGVPPHDRAYGNRDVLTAHRGATGRAVDNHRSESQK
jgi:hypothetical protein